MTRNHKLPHNSKMDWIILKSTLTVSKIAQNRPEIALEIASFLWFSWMYRIDQVFPCVQWCVSSSKLRLSAKIIHFCDFSDFNYDSILRTYESYKHVKVKCYENNMRNYKSFDSFDRKTRISWFVRFMVSKNESK